MCYEVSGWLRKEKRGSRQQEPRNVTSEATAVRQAPPEPVKPAEVQPRVREEEKIPA